jgi:5-methylthioadenosine/S-adenosylhomocysteine deaminase
MQPINNIPCNIVYSGSKQNVMMTMVGGRILYENRGGEQSFYVGEECAEIYRDAQRIRDRILG